MKINNGTHKILFSKGKLYLDGVQIAGEGVLPENKEVVFEFHVGQKEESTEIKDSSLLEINVHDSVTGKDLGPGQKK